MKQKHNNHQENYENELNLLRTLINSNNDISYIKDGEGRWIYANDEGARLFGLENVDYRGKKDIELAEYSKFYHEAFMTCIETDEIAWQKRKMSRAEEKINLIEGGYRVFDIVKVPEFDSDGKRKNIIIKGTDITKIKRSQKELEQFKETHLGILDNIKEAVYILDEDFKFLYLNKAAIEMYGYDINDIIGNTPEMLSPEGMNDMEEVSEILKKSFDGEPQFFDFYGMTKDGRIFPKEISSSSVNYYGQKAIISVARDVSLQKQVELDLKNARDKALESDRLKSSFLAILTHELKTPLNAVIGFSDIMHSDTHDADIKYYSKIIYDKGNDLLNILNDTLQMALIDAGEVEIRYERFKISDFMSEIEVLLGTLEKFPNVDLKTSFLDADYEVVTDKTKLIQIMINLLKNALKFTENGYISYGMKNNELNEPYFFVEDTGNGITKEALAIIFQAFRQAEESNSRSHGGLGLGLTISKELVSILGGELKVESKLQKGSIFYFQIPGLIEE